MLVFHNDAKQNELSGFCFIKKRLILLNKFKLICIFNLNN